MSGDEENLLVAVQRQLDALRSHGLTSASDTLLNRKWTAVARRGLAALLGPDGRLDPVAISNFRRDQVLIPDLPTADINGRPLRNRLVAWRRAPRNCLLQCLEILRQRGCDDLLRRYPCPPVGHPHCFEHEGFCFTYRWTRHIYFLGLYRRLLSEALGANPMVLDIGSSYGVFSTLLKQECPGSHHILVDLPEQLLLAHYFIGSYLPKARIAGPAEVLGAGRLTADVLRQFDFVLVPAGLFDRLAPDAVDLLVNLGSFGEMSRPYFDGYWQSPVVSSARYALLVNRLAPLPEHFDNDISVADYPLAEGPARLHFDISPLYSVDFMFEVRHVFWYRVARPPPHFEYVGGLQP